MAKGCSICLHPNAQQIDSLLDSGEFKKNIAEMFPGVSVFALSRHGRGLCRADALDTEEAKWAARLEKTYQQAVTDGDVRGMQQTAAAGLRVVRERKAEKAKQVATTKQVEADGDKISIGSLDEMVSLLTNVPNDPQEKLRYDQAMAEVQRLNAPDYYTIFLMVREREGFGDALRAFSADWLAQKQKGEPHDAPVQAETARAN